MDFNDHKSKKVANWLLLGVFMTVIQVALGGITRLTGSGLSITEWDVVTGALPPMSETTWQELFAKYKTTPQFQLLNFDFTITWPRHPRPSAMTVAPVAMTGRGPYFAMVLPTKLRTLALTKKDNVSAEEIIPIDH